MIERKRARERANIYIYIERENIYNRKHGSKNTDQYVWGKKTHAQSIQA